MVDVADNHTLLPLFSEFAIEIGYGDFPCLPDD